MTAAKPPTPTDRRFAAMNALVDRYLGPDSWSGHIADEQREQVARDIEALAPLGRSPRWKAAIATWAGCVRQREDATHALTQWFIFTGYAA